MTRCASAYLSNVAESQTGATDGGARGCPSWTLHGWVPWPGDRAHGRRRALRLVEPLGLHSRERCDRDRSRGQATDTLAGRASDQLPNFTLKHGRDNRR